MRKILYIRIENLIVFVVIIIGIVCLLHLIKRNFEGREILVDTLVHWLIVGHLFSNCCAARSIEQTFNCRIVVHDFVCVVYRNTSSERL